MMKRISLFLVMISVVLALVQCRKSDVKPQGDTPSYELIEVTLRVSNGESKSEIDGVNINWSLGDKLYAVGATDGYLGGLSAVTVSGTTAEFKGVINAVTTAQDYYFYYVGSNVFALDGSGKYTYSAATQHGKLNASDGDNNIANKMQLMKGKLTDVQPGTTELPDVTLTSMIAIAHLDIRRNGAEYNGNISVTGGYATAKLDAKTGTLTADPAGTITLNGTSSDYYMAMIPGLQMFTFSTGNEERLLVRTVEANRFYNQTTPIVVDMIQIGALPGVFTVSSGPDGIAGNDDDVKVYFSKGNLQYQASTNTWRFAEHQWDYVGATSVNSGTPGGTVSSSSNHLAASDYSGWIDLIGWGCTGSRDTRHMKHATWYQRFWEPWEKHYEVYSTTQNVFGYGPDYYAETRYCLSVEHGSDWGCISTLPGNTATDKVWRTLSGGSGKEFEWLLGPYDSPAPGTNCRTSSTVNGVANARFARVTVNGVVGLLIFPDTFAWKSTMGTAPNNINTRSTGSYSPSYTAAQFDYMESAGCVFLPAAGYRDSNGINLVNDNGVYWSATSINGTNVYDLNFHSTYMKSAFVNARHYGFAVRLIYQIPTTGNGSSDPYGNGGSW